MTFIPLSKRGEIEGLRYLPPFSETSCQSCGEKWVYFTDIENGKHSARCPRCGHVIRIFIKNEKPSTVFITSTGNY